MATPDYVWLYLALYKRQVPLKRESVYVLFSLKNFFYRYKIRIFALYFKDMRIISGSHRGKQLIAPKNLPVRPTTDFAKESLFNILNNYFYLDSIKVLDLFAGTGNISYEFGSRGCPDITAVDSHAGCVQYIHKTAAALSYPIEVIKSDAFTFLERNLSSYDVIFADPPYDLPEQDLERLVSLVFERNLLAPDGLLIIEHSAKISMEENPYFDHDRRYGGTAFSLFNNV